MLAALDGFVLKPSRADRLGKAVELARLPHLVIPGQARAIVDSCFFALNALRHAHKHRTKIFTNARRSLTCVSVPFIDEQKFRGPIASCLPHRHSPTRIEGSPAFWPTPPAA